MLFYFSSFGYSQKVEVKLIDSICGKFSTLSIDVFQNVFAVNDDVIIKYTSGFDTLFSTSLKSLFPSSIETSKSFRTLIFDSKRGVISFLDNTLTEIYSEFDLSEIDILQPILVCESFNGNSIWVLDESEMQLVRINSEFEIEIKIENLGYLFNDYGTPTQMFEKNDELYIHFPNKGVAIFDSFGTYIKFIPVMGSYIQVQNKNIIVLSQNKLLIYEVPFYLQNSNIILLDEKCLNFFINKDRIFILTDNSIKVYSMIRATNNK